jgi:hypothetical protein
MIEALTIIASALIGALAVYASIHHKLSKRDPKTGRFTR